MKLFVDIGNSKIKFVQFDDENFGTVSSVKYDKSSVKNTISGPMSSLSSPVKVICINVAGERVSQQFTDLCREFWGLAPEYIVVSKSVSGVTNGYKDINQLGVDRWMAIVAAWNLVQDNVMVVDFGSALTIDLVNNQGIHQGGYLIPGDYLMTKSLLDNTEITPENGSDKFEFHPGTSTHECIINGTGRAIIGLIMDIYQSINASQQTHFQCVITGGGAVKILDHLPIPFDYQPMLVFNGMMIADGKS